MLISLSKVQKHYGTLAVLSDITVTLDKGQKAALVGHNGTGKSTLLRIIAGLEEVDGGSVKVTKGVRVGYLPQDMRFAGTQTIGEYLDEAGESPDEHAIKAVLAGFGMEDVALDRQLSSLSSGQRTKIGLAALLLKKNDALLLDEPTNNLDLPALIWLEEYLRASDVACIIVSHDRRFLDRVANVIYDLDWNTRSLIIRGGTYSDYIAQKEQDLVTAKEAFVAQRDEVERLEELVKRKKAEALDGQDWSPNDNDGFLRGFKRDQSKDSARTAKATEKRLAHIERLEKPAERGVLVMPIDAAHQPGPRDIRLEDAVIGYQGGFMLGPISIDIRYGTRVGFIGENGTGKSTLLKTLTGHLSPISGIVECGSGAKIGNLMQEHESLPATLSPSAYLMEKADMKEELAFNLLMKFGFDEKQSRRPISALSPGSRARLLLALFTAQSVNVLVLDEPTNHLDIEALAALEETLATYKGTVILVSHDRYFLEKAKLEDIFLIRDGEFARLKDYSAYIAEAEKRASKLPRGL